MKRLLLILLATLLAAFVGACGGDEETASTDVNTLLEQTFSGGKKLESGVVALALDIDARGSQTLSGPVSIKLGGPFESQGDKRLPKFKLDLSFSGAGQSLQAGATSTGDKGYLTLQSQSYELSDQLFKQFQAGFEQAQKESGANSGTSLATLGIDPRKWLTGARIAGEAKVGDEETIKITGGVDVAKLLDDVNTALEKAGSLSQSSGVSTLTAEQKRQVQEAVKALSVEIYTGKEDQILRRMVVDLKLEPGTASEDLESAAVKLDLSLTEVNEGQDIEGPENAKPFDELAGQLGSLGLGLGGSSGSSSKTSDETLEKYADCVREAGNDAAKARKCADLVSP